MMKLFDFQCTVCNNTFEELYSENEVITCPECYNIAEQLKFCNKPTGFAAMDNPIKQHEIMQQGTLIRQKLQGKIPWSKTHESQSR